MFNIIFQNSNAFLDWIQYPPGSIIFIFLLATLTALISTGLTRWLIDMKALNRKQVIIKAHDEEKKKIIDLAEGDPEKYRKLRKRWERLDVVLKQSQQRMAMKRMLPSCITFIPMIIIFSVVRGIFLNNPVALSPMNANDVPLIGPMMAAAGIIQMYGSDISVSIFDGWINFTAWYFLSSFGISTLIQRIFKLQTQATGGMEQMMGGTKAKALTFPDV
ncbi:MAG: EMC3/TMCO1 family protein [Candidatus Thorarchaeota archaeon]